MSSCLDEPQPRHLNHPSRFTEFGNSWRHVGGDVDRAAGRLVRGRRGQDLVMPVVSVGKGRTLALRKSPGGSHDDSGFMGMARQFGLWERETVSWHFCDASSVHSKDAR